MDQTLSFCRTLRVASVQMECPNGRAAQNMERATAFVEEARRRGADLVLLPEFMSTGYLWTTAIWNAAERAVGPTVLWLRRTSQRYRVWLGTSFLEADGEHFYNTFVLTGPDGAEAGRVRKQTSALVEAFFVRGQAGSHVIECALGRVGVGICYDNYHSYLPHEMSVRAVDLMLMPHSAPDFGEMLPPFEASSEVFAKELREVAGHYAKLLGIPTVMSNKCGLWQSGIPFQLPTHFLGSSAIADSDGSVKVQLGREEELIVADVKLDRSLKDTRRPVRHGRWARQNGFSRDAACWLPEQGGMLWYQLSGARGAKARAISAPEPEEFLAPAA